MLIGDGPQKPWLRARLPHAKLTGALETGYLTRAMAALDLLVHPGTEETCCHALREAGASGVPVVAPRAGGALDVVRSMESGLLYDPAEPHGLARAVASPVTGTGPCSASAVASSPYAGTGGPPSTSSSNSTTCRSPYPRTRRTQPDFLRLPGNPGNLTSPVVRSDKSER